MLTKYHGGLAGEGRGQKIDKSLLVQDTQNRFGLVSAFLTKFYNTNIGSDMRLPMPTITGQGQHIGEVRAFLKRYSGHCSRWTGNVAGQKYQIADIGLRMLSPRELAKAQGFPDSYILTGSKSCQVAKIGNSVCPPIAEALVRANVKLMKLENVKAG
jgi:DNA (cytosine-5)-methyltransferase 1